MNYATTVSAVQHKTESPTTETRGEFVPLCAKSSRKVAGWVSTNKKSNEWTKDCPKCFG